MWGVGVAPVCMCRVGLEVAAAVKSCGTEFYTRDLHGIVDVMKYLVERTVVVEDLIFDWPVERMVVSVRSGVISCKGKQIQ